MEPSEPIGRVPMTIALDADCHALVERLISAGVFESREELFATALGALTREMEASARQVAAEHGLQAAEGASLEELADALAALDRPN